MLDTVSTEQITRERLESWGQRLAAAHATPLILVAVGHDDQNGEITVFTTEEMSNDMIAGFLRSVLRTLEG